MEDNKEIEIFCECGKKLKPTYKVCPGCNKLVFYDERKKKLEQKQEKLEKGKTKTIETTKEDPKTEVKDNENSSKGNYYILLILVSIVVMLFTNTPYIYFLPPVVAIIGKLNYPKNKILTIIFWLVLIYFVCCLIISVIFLYTCFNYDWSNCN